MGAGKMGRMKARAEGRPSTVSRRKEEEMETKAGLRRWTIEEEKSRTRAGTERERGEGGTRDGAEARNAGGKGSVWGEGRTGRPRGGASPAQARRGQDRAARAVFE